MRYSLLKYKRKNIVIALLAIIVFSSSALLIIGSMTTKHWVTPTVDDIPWKPLEQAKINEYVAQGKTVFVNVTADWCVTCKANKIDVILQDPVYSTLHQENIIAINGDWTHPSEKVTNYLKSHQRFGVPLSVVYGPNAPQGLPLPVILTSNDVIQAIEYAGRIN